MGSTTYTIPSIFTAIDKFSAPMAKMASKVEAFASRSQRAVNMANGYFNKLMTPLTKVKNMLGEIGIYIGLWQLTRAVRSAFNTIADFEQANVNLASVTEKDSIPYLKALSNQARLMAVNFGIAAVEITNLQYELTKKGFSGKQILDMTPSIALGAKAFRAEAADVADVIGGVLRAYQMTSDKAGEVVNKVLFVANATSADFESFKTQLPIISRVAKIAGVEFEKVLASLGVLRDVQIHTATGSTSFKNFILDAVVKQKKTFDQAVQGLMKADANGKLLNVAFKKYGKKTVVTAVEFARQLDRINELTAQAKNLPANYTQNLASMQMNTLRGRLALLKTAWDELILSIDEGNGKWSSAIKQILNVSRAVLLMASGSDSAREALAQMDSVTKATAITWLGWLDTIWSVVKVFAVMRIMLFMWRAALMAASVVQGLFSVGLAFSVALGKASIMSLRGNAIAMGVLRAITAATTISQWSLNIAMLACPLVLIAVGILGMIGAFKLIDGWIGRMVSGFNSWSDSMLGASSNMQKFDMDFANSPVAKQLEAIKKYDAALAEGRVGYKSDPLDVQNAKINPKATQAESMNYFFDKQRDSNSTMRLEVEDPSRLVRDVKFNGSSIMPKVDSTMLKY